MSNKRINSRIPMQVDAVLNYREHMLICTLRDISMNGAFIEASPEDIPYTNSWVELALTFTQDGQSKHCRIPARINRITDNGAAITFSDIGLEAHTNLVSIVYNA